MSGSDDAKGLAELRSARWADRGLFVFAFLFSIAVNILMLTGPLYMLQVYDRVLTSRSEETLIALSVLICCLFLAMGILDYSRGRLTALAGARFQDRLDLRVFAASLKRASLVPNDASAIAAQRDLESVQRLLSSPVLLAIFDIPWTPLFVAGIFLFHPLLGWLAIGGGTFLVAVTLINQRVTKGPQQEASLATIRSERMSDQLKAEAELVKALGMTRSGFDRWQSARGAALVKSIDASSKSGVFSTLSKTTRQFLQSAMLGLGAWLVIRQHASPGIMVAATILLGKALSPVEQLVGGWKSLVEARAAGRGQGEGRHRGRQQQPDGDTAAQARCQAGAAAGPQQTRRGDAARRHRGGSGGWKAAGLPTVTG